MEPMELLALIRGTIIHEVKNNDFMTLYRDPLIGFVAASNPGFTKLSEWTETSHLMPEDLLPGARYVVCYFLPFAPEIAYANGIEKEQVARQWAIAYSDTNALIGQINTRLIELLIQYGIQANAEPATGNFVEDTLRSHWSHKSIAVMAGIGSFGLHQLVITDAGCAGRLGSIVIDADLPASKPEQKERCEYFVSESCLDCLLACPVNAIDEKSPFDRWACWQQCLNNAEDFLDLGDDVKVCGKCAVVGPCTLESAV